MKFRLFFQFMRRLAKINDCIFILALMRNHLIKGRRVSQKNWRCKNMQIFFFLFTSNQISILFRDLILTIYWQNQFESIKSLKQADLCCWCGTIFARKNDWLLASNSVLYRLKLTLFFFYFCVDKNIFSNIKRPVVPFNGKFMSHRFARLFLQSFYGTLMSIDILNCLILISWKIYLKNRFRTPNLWEETSEFIWVKFTSDHEIVRI